jgi:hypothetical protein
MLFFCLINYQLNMQQDSIIEHAERQHAIDQAEINM